MNKRDITSTLAGIAMLIGGWFLIPVAFIATVDWLEQFDENAVRHYALWAGSGLIAGTMIWLCLIGILEGI